MKKFDNVTLLITHYNRSNSLERLLKEFRNQEISFGNIIVSDDCSKPEHAQRLQELVKQYHFTLLTTPVNKGLGNNINKGQDAISTPYTLYVQEDFDPYPGCAERLTDALAIMNERQDIDLVRFYAYFKYPYLKPFRKGFSEMKFALWKPGHRKFHVYSDHPHLRRSTFFNKFGRYREGVKGDRTEFLMAQSFLKNKGKAMLYEDHKGVFNQINSAAEPSTMKRSSLRETTNPVISPARAVYRSIKHTLEYLFFPKHKQ